MVALSAKQVGLRRDLGDHLGDVADPVGGLRQLGDPRIGLLRLFDRLMGDLGGQFAPGCRSR